MKGVGECGVCRGMWVGVGLVAGCGYVYDWVYMSGPTHGTKPCPQQQALGLVMAYAGRTPTVAHGSSQFWALHVAAGSRVRPAQCQ